MIRRLICLFLVATIMLLSDSVFAQNTNPNASQIEQSRQFDEGVFPELKKKPGETQTQEDQNQAPSTPGDEDLGDQALLRRKEEKEQPFRFFADAVHLRTTNANMSKSNALEDRFWIHNCGISYVPQITDRLLYEATIQSTLFRYETNFLLDFNSQNIGTGVTYVIEALDDTAVNFRYNYNRLADSIANHEFYQNHTLTMTLQKIWPLSKAHYLMAGQSTQVGMADPYIAQRNEYALFTGYHLDVTRSLQFDFTYRVSYLVYADTNQKNNREDVGQNISGGLTYNLAKWISLNGTVSMAYNNSHEHFNDYDAFTSGAGVALNFKF